MIEVINLKKNFDEVEVLKGINSVFQDGKTNLIIGKSGSGKTVMIKCLVGLFQPTSGSILYDGKELGLMNKKERIQLRREIGMLFQGSALFDSMTVEENVSFPLQMFTKMSVKEIKLRVDEVLERVNLINANNKFPAEISGGMMKRVGIARAIVMRPKYLFCDEPNSGLDPQTAIIIDALIQEITRENNITTIINTHDMNSVMEIGENILFMHKGHKQWQGTKEDIMKSDDTLLHDFIFASNFLKRLKTGYVE